MTTGATWAPASSKPPGGPPARLWGSADADHAVGTSTLSSSEAAMLAGLALKWRWKARRQAAGAATAAPNLVLGANVQVCWEKFCRYFDVEPRMVPAEAATTT
jgi:glutamate decarboxylase